ncbi:MFS transporter [Desulfovibrio litoralis]|uniref:MFS transporter, MHS family, metabolite:H+ symporter n=1 Tax=Desulfovibrio litoralis DSM 11393 TaxID=1121455 RepID=A0A1M7RRW0_9BACT|nr:MFS transporter [Desulfovibrio litoralis]SHN48964.1 MFS transporter, MHS family, metabolite:H+ symporter [Desulfovibrio litoralis DSM 11393]
MSNTTEFDQDKNLRKIVISSILGAVIEWYDFFLYGVVASLFFNHLYFPSFDPTVGTLLAFATFAIGFVARPLGGIVFGHFGDKIGRKKVLILTLQIMGVATVGIGLIPSYEQIGIWAPILLIICRLAQGLGLGGEWGGAVLMSFESAPASKRAFYGSLPQIGMSLGLLLATGVIALLSATLSDEAFLSWGWRLAFIASAVLLAVGSYMRSSIHETQDFKEAKEQRPEVKYPLLDAFKRYPKMMIACMGARFIDGVSFNVFGVYSLTYLTTTHNIHRDVALSSLMIAAIVMTLCIPFWGAVADKIGKAKIYGGSALMVGILSFPAFWILNNYPDHFMLVTLALGIPFGIFHAAVFGTMAGLFSESFDASVRYSGISFVYQFTAIFASGLTPMIAITLTEWNDHQPWFLCIYLLVVAIMSAACTVWMARMRKQQLLDGHN